MRSTFVVWFTLSLPLALGCGPQQFGTDDEAGDGDGDCGECDDGYLELQLTSNKDVDVLIVVDNSGSMGLAQAKFANGFASFIDVLDDPSVAANYRIGLTTSDNGNPWCPAGTTTPEGGKLVLSSCQTRLGDFTFSDTVDVRDLACNDLCTLGPAELEVLPSTTDYDLDMAPRPWLERIEGMQNLPEGTDMAEAFKCFAPQGVNGCGFESQLESMYLAIARTQDSSEASYGFMRDSAILAIVIVTDEVDCSYNKEWSDIFSQDGNKVFWSDPSASFPTSALCWNAGVQCTGDPSGYAACDPINKGIAGELEVSDADAVLHPLKRYIDRVQGIEDAKKELDPTQKVIVALIGGVAEDGSIFYADVGASDPVFQDSFGIGPGCTNFEGQTGLPPVRMRDFVEASTPGNLFSICASDYSPAFQAIANSIRDQIQPACHPQCVWDSKPETEVVDPVCSVRQKSPGLDAIEVQECVRELDGSYAVDPDTLGYTLPDAVDVCYALLVDPGNLTSDPNDDMSIACTDLHYNLEFELARRAGVPAPGGTAVSVKCTLADDPNACPNLGIPG